MYVHHSPETKTQAIELRNPGMSVAAISNELHIAESTLRNWFLAYATPQEIVDEQAAKEVSRLSSECTHLQHIIEIIRRSGFINEISLQRRVEFSLNLYKQNAGYTAREIYPFLYWTKVFHELR